MTFHEGSLKSPWKKISIFCANPVTPSLKVLFKDWCFFFLSIIIYPFTTLNLHGRPGWDGCQSALWDCFSTWRQIYLPKQSHIALWLPSRPSLLCNLKSGELEDVINLAHSLNALMYANKSQLNSIIMRKQSCYSITWSYALCPDIMSWNVSNMLKCTCNPKKTEIIHFSSRFSPADSVATIKVGDYSVTPRNRVKDLGDKLDCHLTFKIHLNNFFCSASHSIHHIRKIKNFLSRSATERSVLSMHLFLQYLDFCSSILHSLSSYKLKKLQW